MGISITGTFPGQPAEARRAKVLRPATALVGSIAALLGVVPRTARRLFDRVGTGLQRFDDNLWDGGDGS